MQNNQIHARAGFWEMEWLTQFFTWLFMVLSRLAEPLTSLSALYIIIETGVKSLHAAAVENFALACLLGAPEIIAPGAFILASQAAAQGRRNAARVIYTCAALFIAMTGVTLADLFLWKLDGQPLAMLMFARCGVAIGYSIAFRIVTQQAHVTHPATSHGANPPTRQPANPPQQPATNPPTAPVINPPNAGVSGGPSTPPIPATNPPAQPATPAAPATPESALPAASPEVANPPTRQILATKARQRTRHEPASMKRQIPATMAANQTTEQRILAYRRQHPEASQKEIAAALSVSLRSVQRYDRAKPALHIVNS